MVVCFSRVGVCRCSTVGFFFVGLLLLRSSRGSAFDKLGENVSSVSSSTSSWALVMRVVCPTAAVVVVTIAGRGSCWLFESAAHEVAVYGVR